MMWMVTRKVLLVIHRIVGIFQFDIARHVAVVVLLVADTVAGHHHLLVMMVTFASATAGRRRGSAVASAATTTPSAGSLLLTIRWLILRSVFAVLLDPFVLRPPILEPNFDL